MTTVIAKCVADILVTAGITKATAVLNMVKMRASISFTSGKVIYFVFKDSDSSPCAVVKQTMAGSTISAAQEYKNLQTVYACLQGTEIQTSIPQPYGVKILPDQEISVESYVGDNGTQRPIDASYISEVFAWLKNYYLIHKNKNSLVTVTAETVKKQIVAYEQLIPRLFPKPEYRDRLMTFVDTFFVGQKQIIGFPQHGDFHSGNILLVAGQLKIVDWGRYGFTALPAMDAWFFARRCPGGVTAQQNELKEYFAATGISEAEQNFCAVMSDLFDSLERYAIGNTPYTSDFFTLFFERNQSASL